ncbi:hypothetical protein PsYK624_053970 [Phanerochaete sordida]|uniref:Uncharacterized protein n=1 Tax=Phanerochaete sordida TaxID=48140 RepID=A0A9P3G7L5_9APHY|nr:hypothetical protein PsYK624_053970 [Phanerochaete sordida]
MLVALTRDRISAALVNVTVDDQGADPTSKFELSFNPPWTLGQNCSGCEAQPDPKQVHGGTWSDITYDPSSPTRTFPQNATFDFTGPAVYVYGIQSHATTDPVSEADIVFYIDGTRLGNYKFTPNSTDNAYTYNQLLFKAEGLGQASHLLKIQNGQIGGPISLTLLDYLVYSTNDTSGTSVPVISFPTGIPGAFSVSNPKSSRGAGTTPASAAVQPPSSSAATSTSNHSPSDTARTAIIAVAAAIGMLALLLLVCLARRRRYRTPTALSRAILIPVDTMNILPQTAHVYIAGNSPAPPYSDPAPSYASVYFPLDPPRPAWMEQVGPSTSRLPAGTALPAANASIPEAGPRPYPRSEFGGSSVAPGTAPPLYRSEAGTEEQVVQPVL